MTDLCSAVLKLITLESRGLDLALANLVTLDMQRDHPKTFSQSGTFSFTRWSSVGGVADEVKPARLLGNSEHTSCSPYSSLTMVPDNPEKGFLSQGTDEEIVGIYLLKNYLHSADTDSVTLGQIGGQDAGIRRRPYSPFP